MCRRSERQSNGQRQETPTKQELVRLGLRIEVLFFLYEGHETNRG